MRYPILRFFAFLLLGLALVGCQALPSARRLTFDVRAYGATGDGTTLDTDAINRAITAAADAGGGTVWFPAGTYASYSVRLKSNVTLYLDQGATLLAAEPPAAGQPGGYDAPEANPWEKYQDFGHTHWHNSLIWGENLENIAILGPGRIFGRGLSRGQGSRNNSPVPRFDPLPAALLPPLTTAERPALPPALTTAERPARRGDGAGSDLPTPERPFGYPNPTDTLPAGIGNKAIALKNCRNVILRDFTIFHGGHFGILATATDNFTIDNLKIDTNRDGMDIDCCRNVRVSNCTVNSPADDGICLKSSFGLGYNRACEDITITNCQVSGYWEGSLLDGTFKRMTRPNGSPTGRIKFGTEANGGFKNVTIANCVFDYCRGLALEEVDGGTMEDVTITNLTMRNIVNAPIFIRLGARQRGPDNPPVGVARRITISNVVATNVAADQGILIVGLPDFKIADVSLSHILIEFRGGGTAVQAARDVAELEKAYPEPSSFGFLPAYGLFARHVTGLTVDHLEVRYTQADLRPAVMLDDVTAADFDHLKAQHADATATFVLKNVNGFNLHASPTLPETRRLEPIAREQF